MKIQVLGTGCSKCLKLVENASAAVSEMGLDCEVDKVTDINEIMGFGVMLMPGLVVDGEVRSSGKVLSVDEIKRLLDK